MFRYFKSYQNWLAQDSASLSKWFMLLLIQVCIGVLLLISPLIALVTVVGLAFILPIIYLSPSLVYILILLSVPSQYFQAGIRGVADIKIVHIVTAVGIATWILQLIRKEKIEIDIRMIDLPILLFISWALATVFWTDDVNRTIFANAKLLIVFVTYFVMIFLVKDRPSLNRILLGWLVVSFLWSLVGLYTMIFESIPAAQMLQVSEGMVQKLGKTVRVSAIYGNPNELAFFLSMGVVIALVTYRTVPNKVWKVLSITTIVIGTIVMIGTFSRKSWIGVLISFLVISLKDRRLSGILILVGLISITTVFLSSGTGSFTQALYSRLQSFVLEPQVAMAERAQVWALALDLFYRSPVLGNGAGSFYALAPTIGSELPITHSLYLLILVEYGLVGMALFISFIGTCVVGLFRIFRTNGDSHISYFSLGLLAILASVLFQAFFKTLAFTNYNFISFFTLIAIFLRIYTNTKRRYDIVTC